MPTVFDQLYEELFGKPCTKEGEAFERVSAAVTAILFPNADVGFNKKLRGQFSLSLYQVDVLRKDGDQTIFGEAKDYTKRRKSRSKVGRGDLQKLGGALSDVAVNRGVFYSATDYSREAKRYAKVAQDVVGSPIDLMHIRPSVDQDKNGRITKIILRITIRTIDDNSLTLMPILAPSGEASLQALVQASGGNELCIDLKMERFVDASGAKKLSLSELTSGGFGDSAVVDEAHGCFWLPDHFIEVEHRLVEIRGLEYKVHYLTEVKTLEIVSDGNPRILVKSEDGTVNKLITDKQLQQLVFEKDGNVTAVGLNQHKSL